MMRQDHEGEPVQVLYEQLTRALRATRPDPFGAPVTVAEIYQELVPYRAVRGEGGFAMNADYEHALLRLLSGEDSLIRLEPASAREAILKELKSPNPNVSIYREYAGCDAWVRPLEERRPDVATQDEGNLAAGYAAPWETGGPDHDRAEHTDVPSATSDDIDDIDDDATSTVDVAADDAGRAATDGGFARAATSSSRCIFCDSELPQRRSARYCPHCGGDQQMRPCGECGEPLEPGWSFCVACGAQADA
jgi:hypothetical protein